MEKVIIKVKSSIAGHGALVDVSLIKTVRPEELRGEIVGSYISLGKDNGGVYSRNTPDEIYELILQARKPKWFSFFRK